MSNVATIAQDTLNNYWDHNLPVNPFAIAYNMGVSIYFDPTLRVSGYFDYDNERPFVLINPKESLVRQRFTVFHELGHYILGHAPSPRDPDCNYNINNFRSEERDANAFAAEMIMPEEAVHLYVNKGYKVSDMARLFDVSEQAMRIRLERLGYGDI